MIGWRPLHWEAASAGAPLVTVRRSHTWDWRPRPYRHISGGVGCHWLNLFVLLHNVEADRRNDRAAAEDAQRRRDIVRTNQAAFEEEARRPIDSMFQVTDTQPGVVDKKP